MFNILHVTLYGMDITGETIDVLLGALGEQLASLRARLEIVVIGGSALTALVAAAQWSLTQDPSPGYKMVLADALRFLGVDDADLGG
jgi:hypothetical protein